MLRIKVVIFLSSLLAKLLRLFSRKSSTVQTTSGQHVLFSNTEASKANGVILMLQLHSLPSGLIFHCYCYLSLESSYTLLNHSYKVKVN